LQCRTTGPRSGRDGYQDMTIFLFLGMSLLGSLGALALKVASGLISNRLDRATVKWLLLGATLYLASILINIHLLRRFEYTTVLPLTALGYVWTVLLARFVFGELIDSWKIIAMTLILSGVYLIAR